MTVPNEVSTDTLQQLYDSEINFELSCFWDGGFIWKLAILQTVLQQRDAPPV
jgi:hypothetical protein